MTTQCETIIDNLRLATMTNNGEPYGAIDNGLIAITDGKILFAGARSDCTLQAHQHINGNQRWALPGFIDCHTHLVYAGSRAGEFEQRLQGVSYEQIARQGGGIKSTVAATRQASSETLLALAKQRASRLFEEGVTSIEIKSGYGLDLLTETKMLRVAKQLEDSLPIHIETTYLGAHAVPPEFSHNPQGYIDFVCNTALPYIKEHQLAGCVDVFCENIGFSLAQCRQVFESATQLGLKVKGHVEQLSNMGGAKLACEYRALSVDHIEYLAPADVPALKMHDTVAVLLPGAFYYLHEKTLPPIDALRQHKIPIAIATDLNPGTSPVASLLTSVNMASVLFGLTPEEGLAGITRNAAKALGLHHKGQITQSFDADFTLWDIEQPAQIVHEINTHRPSAIWCGGKHVR